MHVVLYSPPFRMKYTGAVVALFIAVSLAVAPAAGQDTPLVDEPVLESPSAGKAFALSLVLPGLGHRYAHGGDWDGWASIFALADAGMWAGLFGAERHRDHLVESYRTLAVKHAGVDPDDKGRDFYLNVASYLSSDAYTDAQLRDRNWDRVDYAADATYEWAWDSEANFHLFRDTREKSETLRRRRTFFITALVANRLIAGITSIRAARGAERPRAELSLDVPPRGSEGPLVRMTYRFR